MEIKQIDWTNFNTHDLALCIPLITIVIKTLSLVNKVADKIIKFSYNNNICWYTIPGRNALE